MTDTQATDRAAAPSPAEFLASASKPAPVSGSSDWAALYAVELRRIFIEHAARAPRTLQQHLGPSELGVECDRQVAGKMAAIPGTNHVVDPWPSIRGTAMHTWAAEAFMGENMRSNSLRWVAEQKVTPHPNHPGTADLYDAVEQAVVDHKFLGKSQLPKIRKRPPRHYVVQLLLYGLGYLNLGLPVRRVAIAAYPATEGSIDGLYVWDRPFTSDGRTLLPENLTLLETVFAQTEIRRHQADAILAGRLGLRDVIAETDRDLCYFCPFYRLDADRTGVGCPGPDGPANPAYAVPEITAATSSSDATADDGSGAAVAATQPPDASSPASDGSA